MLATSPSPENIAIVFPSPEKVLQGTALVPLLPRYKSLFDDCLSNLQTEKAQAMEALNSGVASLQEAIKNKRTYRQQTHIPAWVYSLFDWMGWGAVARAEKELHRVILEVFNRAVNSPALQEDIPAFLDRIEFRYLQKYQEHALAKEIGKQERVQEILCRKGILKPSFILMLESPQYDAVQDVFKKQLLWVLGSNYDRLADLQFESSDEPGLPLNLFQHCIKCNHFPLVEWMIDEVLPRCSEGVQKNLLQQNGTRTGGTHNAVHMLAESLGSQIDFPLIQWQEPITVGLIRKKNPLLGKLIARFNEVSYPQGVTDLKDALIYCHGYRRNWPLPSNREVFLKSMLENP